MKLEIDLLNIGNDSGIMSGGGDDDADSLERVCRVFSEMLSVGFTALPDGDLRRWRAGKQHLKHIYIFAFR